MYIMNPHLLCEGCGAELRSIEGTAVPSIDIILFREWHRCHSGHDWAKAVSLAMPTRYARRIINGHSRLVRIDRETLPGQLSMLDSHHARD